MAATELHQLASRHLWPHFTNLRTHVTGGSPVIVHGEGCYVFDESGKRFLDGTAGHMCVNAGHGRTEFADVASTQLRELGYWSNWGYSSPPAIRLAARLAGLAPGDLNRVFLTSGGSEAVETALKLARNYHRLTGDGHRTKVIARTNGYHGTSFGALSATGVPSARVAFEPLVPGARHVPNTLRRPDDRAGLLPAADAIEECILFERPESVSCVLLEPIQNVGGCLAPPPGYFEKVRAICDRHGILLISDEVISGWGRVGSIFGGDRYGVKPDMVTMAKGLASGYAPVGALIAADRIADAFVDADAIFQHGFTFGGHPVSSAVALENINIFERESLCARVRDHEGDFLATLHRLTDLPIVGEIRGDGYFWGIELVRDADAEARFSSSEGSGVVRRLRADLHERGLICRVDDRGDPVIQLAPPCTAGQEEFDEIESILRASLEQVAAELVA